MVDSLANTDRIAYVEILSSGDAVGSSHFISLSCKRNRCVLTIKDRETSKAREKKRKIKIDRIVYDTIVNIIGEYDLTKLFAKFGIDILKLMSGMFCHNALRMSNDRKVMRSTE